MKRLVCLLAVVLMAAPVMADVAINVADNGDGSVTISYEATGGAVVRGLGLEVDVDSALPDGAYETGSTDPTLNAMIDFYVGNTILEDMVDETELPGPGAHPIAQVDAAGALDPAGQMAIAICAGALDNSGAGGGAAASGNIAKLMVCDDGVESVAVTVSLNDKRGGVVGDNLGTVTINNLPDPVGCGGCDCPGDVAGPAGPGPNGDISSADVIALLIHIRDNGVSGVAPLTPELECGDVAGPAGPGPNGDISSADVIALLIQIRDNGVSGVAPCLVLP